MHDRDVKAPSERAKLAGACAAGQWPPRRGAEGFLAGVTAVGTATVDAEEPHLTSTYCILLVAGILFSFFIVLRHRTFRVLT